MVSVVPSFLQGWDWHYYSGFSGNEIRTTNGHRYLDNPWDTTKSVREYPDVLRL